MAVTTHTFTTTASQVWASATWSPSDPSYVINTHLTNWITAINDPTIISMVHSPGDATSRTGSSLVRWLLRARGEGDTSSDYGIIFLEEPADGSSASSASGCYYARTAGTANNGAGAFSSIASTGGFSLSSARSHFIAYEGTGTRPWFAYSNTILGTPGSGYTHVLARLSTSSAVAGSYYPTSGLGKWAYFVGESSLKLYTPQARINTPYIGIPDASTRTPVIPYPDITYGANYFFKIPGLYGPVHYLGETSSDLLLSSGVTGNWGDTVVFSGVTYRSLETNNNNMPHIWARVS